MLALYRRQTTGKGGRVATSLMANGTWSNATSIQAVLSEGKVEHRPAREAAQSALNNFYQSRDGRWFHLIVITGFERFPKLMECLGRPEIGADPRFGSREDCLENAGALIGELDIAFGGMEAADIRRSLTEGGFTFGEIHQIGDAMNDQQMRDGGALRPVADPRAGADWVVDTPLTVAGEEKAEPVMAPDLGEHTDAVLEAAGYDAAEIAAMRKSGAIE